MFVFVKCPSCLSKIDLGPKPKPYQRQVCPECDTSLELMKIDPPVLDWAFSDNEEFYDNLELSMWSL